MRIDVLAQELGLTRGSFYWHFDDRAAFLDELLDTWERRSADEVIKRVESEGGDPRDKVWRSGMLTFSKEILPMGLSVREWARRDKSVATRLRRVDNQRMEYLRSLISAFCTDPKDVEARSLLAFSLAIGNHLIAADLAHTRKEMSERATDLLLS